MTRDKDIVEDAVGGFMVPGQSANAMIPAQEVQALGPNDNAVRTGRFPGGRLATIAAASDETWAQAMGEVHLIVEEHDPDLLVAHTFQFNKATDLAGQARGTILPPVRNSSGDRGGTGAAHPGGCCVAHGCGRDFPGCHQ